MDMLLKNGLKRVLTFSYDDGYRSDVRLIEIMKKYGMRGTFNLNSGFMIDSANGAEKDRPNPHLTPDVVKDVYIANGMEVAVHGIRHAMVTNLTPIDLIEEIWEDRKALEKMSGTMVRGMAYPFGAVNDLVVQACKNAEIVYSRTTTSTHRFDFPQDWLHLPATCHHNDPELLNLADAFLNNPWNQRWPQLFYVWGHSYEFFNQENWDVMEKLGQMVGLRDDVWYATNLEVYEYIEAYRHLVLSADGQHIYNPTALTVWVSREGQTIEIKAGETV